MKARVIHLPRHRERRDHIERQMEHAGFDWEFWPATDAQGLQRENFRGWLSGRHLDCPWMSQANGTAASCISHLRLWHWLLGIFPDEGVAFVFEDDVEIRPHMARRWLEIRDELPVDWDFTFFSPHDDRCLDPRGRHSEHFHRLIRVEACPAVHAYAVNVRRLSVNLPKILPLLEELDLHLARRLAGLKLFVHGHPDWLARAAPDMPSVRREMDDSPS